MTEKYLSVLFADVSGSSQLFKTRGDQQARSITASIVDMMKTNAIQNQGTVIKTIGDEIMATFPSPDSALKAAFAMQSSTLLAQHQLALRIGSNYGIVIHEGDDIFGETVNDAAAIVSIAKAHQILVSKSTYLNANPELQTQMECFDQVQLKGGNRKEAIYRALATSNNGNSSAIDSKATMIHLPAINPQGRTKIQQELQLSFNGRTISLNEEDLPFFIGRNEDQDLIIKDPKASRQHCSIEAKNGKFILSDNSSNGTYLSNQGKEELYLRRESMPLTSQGLIFFPEKSEEDYISFSFSSH